MSESTESMESLHSLIDTMYKFADLINDGDLEPGQTTQKSIDDFLLNEALSDSMAGDSLRQAMSESDMLDGPGVTNPFENADILELVKRRKNIRTQIAVADLEAERQRTNTTLAQLYAADQMVSILTERYEEALEKIAALEESQERLQSSNEDLASRLHETLHENDRLWGANATLGSTALEQQTARINITRRIQGFLDEDPSSKSSKKVVKFIKELLKIATPPENQAGSSETEKSAGTESSL